MEMPRALLALIVALVACLAACAHVEVVNDPPPAGLAPLATVAEEWSDGLLPVLEATVNAALEERFPRARVEVEELTLLADGSTWRTSAVTLRFSLQPARLDLSPDGLGLAAEMTYAGLPASLSVTSPLGLCRLRVAFPPLSVRSSLALDAAGPFAAVVATGEPTLLGLQDPLLTPEDCPQLPPAAVLTPLATALKEHVAAGLPAEGEAFLAPFLTQGMTHLGPRGVRLSGLGTEDASLAAWRALQPDSSLWSRRVDVLMDGDQSVCRSPGEEPPQVVYFASPPDARPCRLRQSLPAAGMAQVVFTFGRAGGLCEERLLEARGEQRPAFVPAPPGLRVSPPFRTVVVPESIRNLRVEPAASGGVLTSLDGLFVVRQYARLDDTETLLADARWDGRLGLRLYANAGRVGVELAPLSGSLVAAQTRVFPFPAGWVPLAFVWWARNAAQPDFAAALDLLFTHPGPPLELPVTAVLAADDGLVFCHDAKEGP
jgi:hypothetical protein